MEIIEDDKPRGEQKSRVENGTQSRGEQKSRVQNGTKARVDKFDEEAKSVEETSNAFKIHLIDISSVEFDPANREKV